MSKLIDVYDEEKTCEYKCETYSARDNGAVMRHSKEGKKIRKLDNVWTFGTLNVQKGYLMIGTEAVHRIVATAFLGEAPTKSHVVDHIDTNRRNNRPTNLRWVTRLENIILNDITRKKLELLCGCTIEEILKDISILRNKRLTPQFDWMRTVSKEEAELSLIKWKKWANEVQEKKDFDNNSINYFKNRIVNGMVFLLEPKDEEITLDNYLKNLKLKRIFCYRYYGKDKTTYKILDYYLNDKTKTLTVATYCSSGIKQYYLTEITCEDNNFNYEARSFFSPDSIDKYMTIARGEKWTGGDVIDDFC